MFFFFFKKKNGEARRRRGRSFGILIGWGKGGVIDKSYRVTLKRVLIDKVGTRSASRLAPFCMRRSTWSIGSFYIH